MSRFAISDIHGCLNTFRYLVEEELQLSLTDTLYLLGDYIDRGPDSKGVLDYIMDLQEIGYNIIPLCGNHEDMMLDARDNSVLLNSWLINGGKATLRSFGVTQSYEIPDKYWSFLQGLGLYVELDDYLLVHAGFNFSAKYPFKERFSMLWIRDFEVDKAILGNRKIVHGHTPISLHEIKAAITSNADVIDIDGGCVFAPSLGYLIGFNLDAKELHAVKNIG